MHDYSRRDGDRLVVERLQRAEVAVCVIDFDADRAAAVEAANAIQQRCMAAER